MSEEPKKRMRPVIIVPIGQLSKRDLKRLNNNDFCVVEAKDPSLIRFCEPPPNGYSEQERAAISLCRFVMRQNNGCTWTKLEFAATLAQFFIDGSPLQSPAQVKK